MKQRAWKGCACRRTREVPARVHRTLLLVLFGFMSSCMSSGDESIGFSSPENFPYSHLSQYNFFVGDIKALEPAVGVVPYQVISPLWADHAGKARFIVLPANGTIDTSDSDGWRYPDGTIIIKNFFITPDLAEPDIWSPIETRLLIMEMGEWKNHTYVWNADRTDAKRHLPGAKIPYTQTDNSGQTTEQEYVVPNTNQCKDCHELNHIGQPLGLVRRQLDREVTRNGEPVRQVDWLNELGIFSPPLNLGNTHSLVDPFGDAPLTARARSYLDANCAHCHRDGGNGGPSGLVLLANEENPTTFGVCKGPVAAGAGTGGLYHDIFPGDPERSIMIFRMRSTDPEVKMPEIPNRIPHQAGIDLISEWIRQLPYPGCDE